jgi:hypothetical protein
LFHCYGAGHRSSGRPCIWHLEGIRDFPVVPAKVPATLAPGAVPQLPTDRLAAPVLAGSAKVENLASRTASSATQCRSNPVSGRYLPKTGIFQISAGDYRRFRSRSAQFRSPETVSQFAKARRQRAFLRLPRAKSPGAALVGWGGTIRTSIWRIGIGCSRLSERSR